MTAIKLKSHPVWLKVDDVQKDNYVCLNRWADKENKVQYPNVLHMQFRIMALKNGLSSFQDRLNTDKY